MLGRCRSLRWKQSDVAGTTQLSQRPLANFAHSLSESTSTALSATPRQSSKNLWSTSRINMGKDLCYSGGSSLMPPILASSSVLAFGPLEASTCRLLQLIYFGKRCKEKFGGLCLDGYVGNILLMRMVVCEPNLQVEYI